MYKTIVYLLTTFSLMIVLTLVLYHSHRTTDVTAQRQLVGYFGLTDLALCSEARYTRHPSQADLFSPFQDFPGSLEHFPTGSLLVAEPIGLSGRVSFLQSTGQP
jgi:hypothetical protein